MRTRRRARSRQPALAALMLAAAGAASLTGSVGCSSGLETGYTPRPLGVSSAERRAYYASPYTAEAAAGAQSQKANNTGNPGGDNPISRQPNMGPRQY